MKEEYLHFLWRMRCLPARTMSLSKGEELEVIDFGEYNRNESGPDFLHAKVIIDGILWFGSIEFHLKSSDWFAHNHQKDAAYENVILHVVWEHDKEVFSNGRNLPTLLISHHVQHDFSHSFGASKVSSILPCNFSLHSVDTLYIEKEKETMLYARLLRKTASLSINEKEGFAQVLYEFLATAFGAKVNKDPFWELSRKIPVKRLLKINKKNRADIVCLASGVHFNKEEKEKPEKAIVGMQDWQWKRKGLHPKGFPEIRIKQFAHFVQHFDFDFGFLALSASSLLAYIDKSFSLVEKEYELAKSFKNLVIMNSFVPFIWWLGEKRGEQKWQNLAYELLQEIPAETNHITKLMKSTGFSIKTAYDSQALLELYNQRCIRKKCLSCCIGNEILKQ